MSVMNVDYDKLRLILMPHVLRQGGLLEALFAAAFKPLKRCYEAFVCYEAEENKERQYGPTVKQLKAAIADHLGIGAGVVQIGDVEPREATYLRRETDGWNESPLLKAVNSVGYAPEVVWSDDMVWWNREFTVSLPEAYIAFEPAVKAILDRWKMASSRYTITYR